jgi:hypothetical protein
MQTLAQWGKNANIENLHRNKPLKQWGGGGGIE